MNPVVTTNQKPTIDTQKQDTKEHKHITKRSIKPQGKKLKEEEMNRKELQKHPENK